MKCIATIHVDLDRSPLGLRSRLGDELSGRTVLLRTVDRVLRADGIASIHLICHKSQGDRVRELVWGTNVKVETHEAAEPPFSMLVRASRWWGLDSWRGGAGGLTVFDEDIQLDVLQALACREQAEAVVSIPAAAVLIDPAIIDGMIRQQRQNRDTAKMTFIQAPPGLATIVLTRELIDDLVPTGQPPGVLLSYHPDRPIPDLTGREACFRPGAEVIEASGRLLADTQRGMERLQELLADGGETWDASRIARWLLHRRESHVERIPTEIELELTTEDTLKSSLLRPRGRETAPRGPLRSDVVEEVLSFIADYDDVRIVLAGHGEPTLHPALGEICGQLRRSAAVGAIAVRTNGIIAGDPARADAVEEALFSTPVDLVEVTLDAATAETYQRVHGLDAFEAVVARLHRWIDRREQRHQVRPLVVPSFIKANENIEDMETFFDTWQGRLGMSLITGYSHHGGQRERRAVSSVAPPTRVACLRTFSRVMILADGRMTTCDQDFAGKQTLGAALQSPLAELWNGPSLRTIRGCPSPELPICASCEEWHRP